MCYDTCPVDGTNGPVVWEQFMAYEDIFGAVNVCKYVQNGK